MNYILSFAVGAILGDLFFHLIPESYQSHINEVKDSSVEAHKKVGLSIIAGVFMFIIVELVLERWSNQLDSKPDQACTPKTKKLKIVDKNLAILGKTDLKLDYESQLLSTKLIDQLENNNNTYMNLNECRYDSKEANQKQHIDTTLEQTFRKITEKSHVSNTTPFEQKLDKLGIPQADKLLKCTIVDPAGYLNLIVNSFDNFTHGLAIGASFLVGAKVGLLTTFVIFIHEVPHEICDYAILVNSGFSRLEAVKAQSSVSLFSLLGTFTALYVRSIETLTAQTIWILPFSAGGFLYIALVNLLPEILDCKNGFQDNVAQVACVCLGVAFMAAVAVF